MNAVLPFPSAAEQRYPNLTVIALTLKLPVSRLIAHLKVRSSGQEPPGINQELSATLSHKFTIAYSPESCYGRPQDHIERQSYVELSGTP